MAILFGHLFLNQTLISLRTLNEEQLVLFWISINLVIMKDWKKLDLPTLSYRRFRGWMIETFKILHSYYDDNCVSSLFTFKDTITRGHKLSVRTWQCKTNIRRNFFTVQVNNLWNSLLGYVVESPSVNSLKNRLYKCVYVYMKYVSNVCVCKCLYIYYIYMYIYIYVCVCACMYRYIYTHIIFY